MQAGAPPLMGEQIHDPGLESPPNLVQLHASKKTISAAHKRRDASPTESGSDAARKPLDKRPRNTAQAINATSSLCSSHTEGPELEVAALPLAGDAQEANATVAELEGHVVVHKGRSGSLVLCQPKRATGPAEELDIDAYVEPSSNKTFRRMSWSVLVLHGCGDLSSSWFELSKRLNCKARNIAYIAADSQRALVVLLYKGVDLALQAPAPWKPYKLSSKDPMAFAKALLKCEDVFFTIDVECKEQLARVSAMEAIQPYMRMDEVTFKAHVIDLKEQRRRGDQLCSEAEFLVNHTKDMEKLKELLLKRIECGQCSRTLRRRCASHGTSFSRQVR
jgi:hypothetical protein